MPLRKVLTSQEGFAGEFEKTPKTQALLHVNESNSEMHSDALETAEERVSALPTGFPRYVADGTDEDKVHYKHRFDGTDTDITLDGAVYEAVEGWFFEEALRCSSGRAWMPTIPTQEQNIRAVNVWIKPHANDLDGENWHIVATQRTDGNKGYHITVWGDGVVFRAYDSAGTMIVDTTASLFPLTAEQWTLVTFIHSTTAWEIRKNGISVESGSLASEIAYDVNQWELGRMGGSYPYNGLIGGMFLVEEFWDGTQVSNYYTKRNDTIQLLPTGMSLDVTGDWEWLYDIDASGRGVRRTSETGSIKLTFTGRKVEWITRRGPDLGEANVYIDDVLMDTIDLYAVSIQHQQVVYTKGEMTYGEHSILIEWVSDTIYHDAFRVTPGENETKDASGYGRHAKIFKWEGTTASFVGGRFGNYFKWNTSDPAVEQTYLKVPNSGNLFTNLGKKFVIGGYIIPTYYAVSSSFVPLGSTRDGPGNPFFYMAIQTGKINARLYDTNGNSIYSTTETGMTALSSGRRYFVGCVVDLENKTVQVVVGDMFATPITWWIGPERDYTGDVNPSCVADFYFGYLQGSYWYSGGFDEWFYEKDSDLTVEDLEFYFRSAALTNGGNTDPAVSKVDPYTLPGGLILKKENEIAYYSSGVFESRAIDLDYDFEGTGQLKITVDYEPGITEVGSIQTRAATDLTTEDWSPWINIGEDGIIESPNQRYLQIRFTLSTIDTLLTPEVLEIQVHDISKAPYERLGFARPVILTQSGTRRAVLENAFDIILMEEINGVQQLQFKLPYKDPKRAEIENERLVQLTADIFRIRMVTDERDESGKIITDVYAEAGFYNLGYSEPVEIKNFTNASALTAMNYVLQNTEWNVGTVTVTAQRTWSIDPRTNALAALRRIQELYGGDLVFDNAIQTVSLYESAAEDKGVLFAYRKNMRSIQRVYDTREFITKLYPYGKDDLTISEANEGLSYLTDFTYSSEIRVGIIKNDSFTNPYQLKEWAEQRFAELSQPRVSYVIEVMDLSVLTGWKHETFKLGDIVTVDDQDLGIQIQTRIVCRDYNVQEPWKTVIELSTKLKELGDEAARWQQASSVIEAVESVDRQDVAQLMVFNYLLNSRADDGFAYWANAGFTIDNENGFSGPASFKAVGVPEATKSLLQTIWPAHRDNYTISAQIATENLQKGSSGRVGIEVKIYYDDSSSDTEFLEL